MRTANDGQKETLNLEKEMVFGNFITKMVAYLLKEFIRLALKMVFGNFSPITMDSCRQG